MKLHCPDCGAEVRASDMNLQTALAKCSACNGVFNFRDAVNSQQRQGARPVAKPGSPTGGLVARPSRIKVEELGQALTFRWRWLRPMHFGMLIFCIAWDSFLVFWYSMAFKAGSHVPWLMVVFPIGHLAVGVGMTYAVLTGFLNRTTVESANFMLTIRHGPLPWRGNRSLPAAQIRQLYCEERRSNKGMPTYALSALLTDGHKLILLSGFDQPDEPRYLEQLLEQRLRIQPQPVAGELRA